MPTKFAKFWKCALQVNPHSYLKKFQGQDQGLSENEYNAALVAGCKKSGIQVVGLADHANVHSAHSLREAFTKGGIVVFPGFEVSSTEKIHMVCLFAEGTDAPTLQKYLGSIASAEAQENLPSNLPCLEIAKKVIERGGFWFAAHVTNANGLLRLNQDGGGLAHIWKDCTNVLAAQIPFTIDSLDLKFQRILRNEDPNYLRDRAIALINAKDVRCPEDLKEESVYCWAKMTAPTIDALRMACQDSESRIRLSTELNPDFHSRIERILVRQGYLADLEIDLSPNLNAVVGGRGTGKTTLIEGLRYALERKPISEDCLEIHDSIVEANFRRDQATIEITVTSYSEQSERYIIKKEVDEPSHVFDEEGNEVEISTEALLPRLEIYGQNELLNILKHDEEKSELLSRFLTLDVDIEGEIQSVTRRLSENREKLKAVEGNLEETAEQLQKLSQLSVRQRSFKKLKIQSELSQIQRRESERGFANEIEACLSEIEAVAKTFSDSASEIDIPPLSSGLSGKAKRGLSELNNVVSKCKQEMLNAAGRITNLAAKARTKHTTIKSRLDSVWAGEEAKFHKRLSKLDSLVGKSAPQLGQEYKRVSTEIARLEPFKAKKTQQLEKAEELANERSRLLAALEELRSKRIDKLGRSVKILNSKLKGALKIECVAEGLRQPVKDYLLRCGMSGIGEKRLSFIEDCDQFSIAEFAASAHRGEEALLSTYGRCGISRQAAQEIARLPKYRKRELEEIALPERIDLFLNVGSDKPEMKEVNNLSTGQRCTALLHLLLLDSRDPLIIDQPEDNLDNAFIAEHVVKVLRTSKTNRQFLFATHNANIPIFGDAEWIGVLQEENQTAKLKACGSIDSPEVKNLAADILEGGREAFNRRREKYGL